MRQAQKDYFRTRTNASLVASKDLESQVDKAIKEIYHSSYFLTNENHIHILPCLAQANGYLFSFWEHRTDGDLEIKTLCGFFTSTLN